MRKHVDQLRLRTVTATDSAEDDLDDCLPPTVLPPIDATAENSPPAVCPVPPVRRSMRTRHPPSRYSDQYG